MGWRETLNSRFDSTRGPWDWQDSFEKIHDPSQLRRRFAFWAILYPLPFAGLIVLGKHSLDLTEPGSFAGMLGSVPWLIAAAAYYCNLFHAYRCRKTELAEGHTNGLRNLSRLRRRFMPGFVGLILMAVLVLAFAVHGFLRSNSADPGLWIFAAVIGSIFPIGLWHHWRWYVRLKKDSDDAATAEIALHN